MSEREEGVGGPTADVQMSRQFTLLLPMGLLSDFSENCFENQLLLTVVCSDIIVRLGPKPNLHMLLEETFIKESGKQKRRKNICPTWTLNRALCMWSAQSLPRGTDGWGEIRR